MVAIAWTMVQDAREMHGPARSVRSVPGLEVSRESTEPRTEDHRSVIASQICWTLRRSSQVPRSSAKIRDNRASTVSSCFFFDFDCDISEMRLRFSRFLADRMDLIVLERITLCTHVAHDRI